MRVAITTDWLNSFGGAERVLLELRDMFPDAPLYTTVHDPAGLPPAMRSWEVRTSFLQHLPLARRRHQPFLPLMPRAFERFDLTGFDLVLTSSSAFAKGVRTPPGTINLCYCHTPPRYLWDLYHDYTRSHPLRWMIGPMAGRLRVWDRAAAGRVDHFIANSREVAGRIRRHYGRDSEVIHPPVDVDRFAGVERAAEDFYLVVSRLVEYKRIDLAVAAANRLGRRLVVVGGGRERRRLEAMAGPTVTFTGPLPDDQVTEYYARCRAFLFPGLEDFGIAPVEAQAAGRPVVAYGRGGAAETVLDGTTGVHIQEQTVDAVVAGMLAVEGRQWDPLACRRSAERFHRREFRRRMASIIERVVPGAGAGAASSLPPARLLEPT